ncbi:hypothetical protein [Vibrio anguillarum]|uniref:hypothetical protein n=1 Tax=Vibrio anguillarum TaxID=55601 RepID=UPI000BB5229C|nr:hypothetical protein [Vibrio anguillarum]ATC60139.1 hypothetical protein CMV05_22320 [Vibrio anguillarum]MBF4249414.1 hypothetical protein [Vibrio anguillarum]MBF4307802.1 hypothetical protein [Vibrio anguillarum]MBF4341261.1 hypothetical protein [Vibrio anguillarum]
MITIYTLWPSLVAIDSKIQEVIAGDTDTFEHQSPNESIFIIEIGEVDTEITEDTEDESKPVLLVTKIVAESELPHIAICTLNCEIEKIFIGSDEVNIDDYLLL